MKLANTRERYDRNSTKASDLARQLAFAGLAVVWIFKATDGVHTSVPPELRFPSLLMVATLALDISQYVVSTVIWGLYNRRQERVSLDAERVFYPRKYINWPALAFFWLKLATLAAGYAVLIRYLARML